MTRDAFLFAVVAILLSVTLTSNARGNHCPGEFGSKCCWPTQPGPHPRADEGWRCICDRPDGCHHRCSQVHDDPGAQCGGTGSSRCQSPTGILAQPDNTVPGKCIDFQNHFASKGVTEKSGKTHPRTDQEREWAGYTSIDVQFVPQWSYQGNWKVLQDGKVEVCREVTSLMPNFYPKIAEQDVLQWKSGQQLAASCSKAYEGWLKQVIDHEQEHVRRARKIVDKANAAWDDSFKPKVCRQATITAGPRPQSVEAARKAAEKETTQAIDGLVAEHLLAPAKELAKSIIEDGNVMHQTSLVPPIDCGSCP